MSLSADGVSRRPRRPVVVGYRVLDRCTADVITQLPVLRRAALALTTARPRVDDDDVTHAWTGVFGHLAAERQHLPADLVT